LRGPNVLRLVLADSLKPALAGIAAGVAAALAVARLLNSLLYGVSAHDGATFLAVCAMMLAVAAAASWLPAQGRSPSSPRAP